MLTLSKHRVGRVQIALRRGAHVENVVNFDENSCFCCAKRCERTRTSKKHRKLPPKSPPGCSRGAPGRPRAAPGPPRGSPGGVPGGPPGAPGGAPDAPGMLRRLRRLLTTLFSCFSGVPGAILGRFRVSPGGSRERFSVDFGSIWDRLTRRSKRPDRPTNTIAQPDRPDIDRKKLHRPARSTSTSSEQLSSTTNSTI